MRCVLAGFALASLVACTMEPPIEVGESEQAIVGGDATEAFPAVGYLFNASGNALPHCGATLIGERALLTAGHCVNKKHTDVEANPASPDDIHFHTVSHVDDAARSNRFIAESVHVHPQYQGGTRWDLAVVILRDAPPAEIPRLPVAIEQPVRGETIGIVGFGMDERNRVGRKRIAETRIAGFQLLEPPAEEPPTEEPPAEEPPAPDTPQNDSESTLEAMTLWMFGSANLCNGDSGGATIALRDGHHVLLGVHTAILGDCGQRGFSMVVPTFVDWILEAADGDVTFVPADELDRDDAEECDRCDGFGGSLGEGAPAGCSAGSSASGSWMWLLFGSVGLLRRRRRRLET